MYQAWFCSSISSFASSNTGFSGFFELKFSRVWVLRVKTRRIFEFRVAQSGTNCYFFQHLDTLLARMIKFANESFVKTFNSVALIEDPHLKSDFTCKCQIIQHGILCKSSKCQLFERGNQMAAYYPDSKIKPAYILWFFYSVANFAHFLENWVTTLSIFVSTII